MRGTEPTPTRLQGRGNHLRPLVDRTGGRTGMERFADVNPDLWLAAINGCLVAGSGLLISRTSDGGAVSLTLYEGNERSRSYSASSDELAEALAVIRDRAQAAHP